MIKVVKVGKGVKTIMAHNFRNWVTCYFKNDQVFVFDPICVIISLREEPDWIVIIPKNDEPRVSVVRIEKSELDSLISVISNKCGDKMLLDVAAKKVCLMFIMLVNIVSYLWVLIRTDWQTTSIWLTAILTHITLIRFMISSMAVCSYKGHTIQMREKQKKRKNYTKCKILNWIMIVMLL